MELVGKRLNRLTVTSFKEVLVTKSGQRRYIFNCVCDCGNSTTARRDSLLSLQRKSCGCERKKHQASGNARRSHNKSRTRIYRIWSGMMARCRLPNRGKTYASLEVDRDWHIFENFYRDMSESYLLHCRQHGIKQTTVDRIDNSKGYSKSNCRWATYKIQANNKNK